MDKVQNHEEVVAVLSIGITDWVIHILSMKKSVILKKNLMCTFVLNMVSFFCLTIMESQNFIAELYCRD